jgi:hypothetical protein
MPTMSRRHLLGLALIACCSGAAAADDGALRFSGFGTLGAAWFSSRDADYQTGQDYGPGRTHGVTYNLDTLLAGQVDWQITPRLGATVQAMSAEKPDRSWAPFIRLANLRYAVTDDLHLRLGYLPNQLMLAGEYRWVNYGNPWPRPPADVYRLLARSDNILAGADLTLVSHHDFGRLTWQAGMVESSSLAARSNSAGADEIKARSLSASVEWERGDWKAKLSLVPWGNYSIDPEQSRSLLALLRALDPAQARYFDNDGNQRTVGLSLAHDSETWFFMSEVLARRNYNSVNRDFTTAYASLGYRVARALPYVTVMRHENRRAADHPDSNAATADLLAALDRSQNAAQSTLAIGVSYDLNSRMQLKTQLDFIRPDHDSRGLLTNHSASYNLARPPIERLLSVSVDFIF